MVKLGRIRPSQVFSRIDTRSIAFLHRFVTITQHPGPTTEKLLIHDQQVFSSLEIDKHIVLAHIDQQKRICQFDFEHTN